MKAYGGYTWSDAWLLLSIEAATNQKSPATITDIRLYGDALNRAWFEDKELEHGFNNLIRDGFITKENNMVILTEKGKSIVLSVRKPKYSFLDELHALYKVFNIKPPVYNLDVPKEVDNIRNKYYQIAKQLNAPEKFVKFYVRPYYTCAYVEFKDGEL